MEHNVFHRQVHAHAGADSDCICRICKRLEAGYEMARKVLPTVRARSFIKCLLLTRTRKSNRSLRRKHGIPDNDHRSFNVAYAAVLRAKREDSNKNVPPAGRTPVATQGGQAVSDQRQGTQQANGNSYTPLETTASTAGSIRQRQGGLSFCLIS